MSLVIGTVHLLWLRRPFQRLRNLVVQLSRGKVPPFEASTVPDETGELERLMAEHLDNLRAMAGFARAMASGDHSGRYEMLSSDDEIGEALLSLNASMMESLDETEKRRREEEHRTWTAQGMAKFSKLFREVEDNLQDLSMALMRELAGYTEADVGALFIVSDQEDGEQLLELTGSYAFDRGKHVSRSFQFGEGLVGRTAMEKEVVYITDLPAEYIKIRSGLGEDVPSSILLVPVVLDDNVLGVIELASLGEIPAYQIAFIRQLADAFATTLAKVKANLQSRKLFEQTKKQAEALASQETVFRQNLEKLERAQHECSERESKLREEIERLKSKS